MGFLPPPLRKLNVFSVILEGICPGYSVYSIKPCSELAVWPCKHWPPHWLQIQYRGNDHTGRSKQRPVPRPRRRRSNQAPSRAPSRCLVGTAHPTKSCFAVSAASLPERAGLAAGAGSPGRGLRVGPKPVLLLQQDACSPTLIIFFLGQSWTPVRRQQDINFYFVFRLLFSRAQRDARPSLP